MIEQKSLLEWRIVFWLTFGILFITTVAYTLWASGEVQPWNDSIAKAETTIADKWASAERGIDGLERGEDVDEDREKPQPSDKN